MTTTVELYYKNGQWMFDDYEKGIEEEPFVGGSSEIIDEALYDDRGPLLLNFSDEVSLDYTLSFIESDGEWSKYYCKELDMIGWLCPVLFEYYSYPPPQVLQFSIINPH